MYQSVSAGVAHEQKKVQLAGFYFKCIMKYIPECFYFIGEKIKHAISVLIA